MSLSNLPGLKLLLLCTLMFPKTSSFNRYNSGFSSDFFSRLRNFPPPSYDGEIRKFPYSPIIKSDSLMPIRQASDIDDQGLHSLLTGSKRPDIPKQPSWSQPKESPAVSSDYFQKYALPKSLFDTSGANKPSWSQLEKKPTVSSVDPSFAVKDDNFGTDSSSRKRKDPPPNDSYKHSIVRLPSRVRPENKESRLPTPRDDKPSSSRFPLARDDKPSMTSEENKSAPSFDLGGLFGSSGTNTPTPPKDDKQSSPPSNYSEWNHQNTDASSEPTCECGLVNSQQTRIVGGKTAPENFYKLIALLQVLSGICGGSVITVFHILSAAHCFYTHLDPTYGPLRETLDKWEHVNMDEMIKNAELNNPVKRVLTTNEITIYLGTHSMNELRPENMYHVAEVILHEDYGKKNTSLNDIAILVTTKQMEFNEKVSPACLPNNKLQLVGKPLKIIGWGQTKGTADRTYLQEADFAVIPPNECIQKIISDHDDVTGGKLICLNYSAQATYVGDSGGPVLYYEKQKYIQAGLVSKHVRNAYSTEPKGKLPPDPSKITIFDIGLQTDIFGYISWIKETISRTKSGVMACTVDGLFI